MMFGFLKRRSTAPVARERLQILLAHERALSGKSDLAAVLQEEILAVIARHVAIDRDKVQVKVDRDGSVSTLEIDIEMPEAVAKAETAERPSAKPSAGKAAGTPKGHAA